MIFRFRKGIFLAGFACYEMKTLTLSCLDTVLPFALAFYDHIILSKRSRQCPVSTKWLPTPPSPAGKAALTRPALPSIPISLLAANPIPLLQ